MGHLFVALSFNVNSADRLSLSFFLLRVRSIDRIPRNRNMDLIHKWRSIYDSFVQVQISLPSLYTILLIEKNSCSKMRLGRLICTWTKEL